MACLVLLARLCRLRLVPGLLLPRRRRLSRTHPWAEVAIVCQPSAFFHSTSRSMPTANAEDTPRSTGGPKARLTRELSDPICPSAFAVGVPRTGAKNKSVTAPSSGTSVPIFFQHLGACRRRTPRTRVDLLDGPETRLTEDLSDAILPTRFAPRCWPSARPGEICSKIGRPRSAAARSPSRHRGPVFDPSAVSGAPSALPM